jgi:hypothetical protein
MGQQLSNPFDGTDGDARSEQESTASPSGDRLSLMENRNRKKRDSGIESKVFTKTLEGIVLYVSHPVSNPSFWQGK